MNTLIGVEPEDWDERLEDIYTTDKNSYDHLMIIGHPQGFEADEVLEPGNYGDDSFTDTAVVSDDITVLGELQKVEEVSRNLLMEDDDTSVEVYTNDDVFVYELNKWERKYEKLRGFRARILP